ncbi:MAG: hypothetical protein U5R31_17290 [Acidimicrobiia bacterium]|nr:hypothetical protein [Acidimicrobiia bacterium]
MKAFPPVSAPRGSPSAIPAPADRTERPLTELLLPTTDGGVYAQAAGALVVYATALWFVRHNRELVVFVVGLATFTAGLMGLRMLH